MEKGLVLEIKFIENCASTHLLLTGALKRGEIKHDTLIYAGEQSAGVGSRGNEWVSQKGNFFASMALRQSALPADLPKVSVAIYFAMLIKGLLAGLGSKVWVKWPNDLYLNDKKVGGLISTLLGDFCVISVGINLILAPKDAGVLDVSVSSKELANMLADLSDMPSWGEVFTIFKAEFEKSRDFKSHSNGKIFDLFTAELLNDGSLKIGDERIYSLR